MKILNQKALDEKLQQASPVVPERIVNEVKSFLLSADDAQLYNINPYRFAARRKLDRTGTLRAFLHLTKGGLFNLFWNIHCPACKGVTQHSSSLRTLKHADTCGVCSTVFDAGFDKSIEVSFGVNQAIIKPAEVEEFAKIVASFDLEPGISIELDRGESHYLKTDLREGNYFLFVNGEQKALNIVVTGDASAQPQKISFDYRDDLPWLTIVAAKQGPADIVIVNKERGKKSMTFARLGPQRWPSAAVVSSLQDFRDLFSSEMLSLNETFSIESLGFLFTDLKGSTEMYERLGDAQAFALVKEHFYIMERLVRRAQRRNRQDHRRCRHGGLHGSARCAPHGRRHDRGVRRPGNRDEAEERDHRQGGHPPRAVHRGDAERADRLLRDHGEHRRAGAGSLRRARRDGLGCDLRREQRGGVPEREGLVERAVHDEPQGAEVELRGAQAPRPGA